MDLGHLFSSFFFFFSYVTQHARSSLTRDETWAPWERGVLATGPDHQGSPTICNLVPFHIIFSPIFIMKLIIIILVIFGHATQLVGS